MDPQQPQSDIYYPMLVSEREGFPDPKEIFLQRWTIFDSLPKSVRDTIIASKTAVGIFNLSQKFHLSEKETAHISRITRSLFLKKLSLSDARKTLTEFLPKNPERQIESILQFIQIYILSPTKKNPVPPSDNTLRLPLLKIMQKYPKISWQKITGKDIQLSPNGKNMPPTVRNWVTLYNHAMGSGYHDSFKRSRFLFQDPNMKSLSQKERRKISLLLHSLDEKTKIALDPKKQQLLFLHSEILTESKKETPDILEKNQKKEADATEPQDVFSRFSSFGKNKNQTPLEKSPSKEDSEKLFAIPKDATQNHQKRPGFFSKKKDSKTIPKDPATFSPSPQKQTIFSTPKTPPSKKSQFPQKQSIKKPLSVRKNMRFSSPHTLPSEEQSTKKPETKSPFIIRPPKSRV